MIIIFGLKSCDTTRKARQWMKNAGHEFRFHELRDDGLDRQRVEKWAAALGWEALLNRRGTTWRKLADEEKVEVGEAQALRLMVTHPSLIKRPIFDFGPGTRRQFSVGFGPEKMTDIIAALAD